MAVVGAKDSAPSFLAAAKAILPWPSNTPQFCYEYIHVLVEYDVQKESFQSFTCESWLVLFT